MTCRRQYKCDLCQSEIRELADGIGITWNACDQIHNVIIASSEHHLCNACIVGLKDMFAEIDRTTEMYQKRDAGDVP